MTIPKSAYQVLDVYKQIAARLRDVHRIRIDDHIESMVLVGRSVAQGITFMPRDSQDLTRVLEGTGAFFPDDRRDFVQAVASAATNGTGYREKDRPSLHCQIGKLICNIHLDQWGFVVEGPDGETYYNPELVQHIADDLLWQTYVVEPARKLSETLGNYVARIHPIVPNSTNGYRPVVGGQVDLLRGHDRDTVSRWKITFDVTRGCRDLQCRQDETYGGLTVRFER